MPAPLFEITPPESHAKLIAAIDALAEKVKNDDPDDKASVVRVELLRVAVAKLAEVPGYKAAEVLRAVREVLADVAPVAPPAQAGDAAAALAAIPRSA